MPSTPRFLITPLFLLGLGWAYQSSISPIGPLLTTEEGQSVAFDRVTWQYRELAKRLPVTEPWPAGPETRAAFRRYGLDDKTPPSAIPVPARIATGVYLLGLYHVSNLTDIRNCSSKGGAIIDPTYEAEFDRTMAN